VNLLHRNYETKQGESYLGRERCSSFDFDHPLHDFMYVRSRIKFLALIHNTAEETVLRSSS